MPTISGLASGIDTDSIVKELLKVRQTRIDVLTAQKQAVADQQTAFKGIESGILSLQGKAANLARSLNNVFDTRTVRTSDETSLIATATTRAATGTYQVRINSLAQSHQVATQGYASSESEITMGTFTLQAGSSGSATITIDSTNNSLTGLMEAINASGAGVTASIVEDASNPAARYRLMLTSNRTGLANAISVTGALADSADGAVRADFDFAQPVQQATDAQVQLGTGPGAVLASSATNTISNLISGVTLNLKQADPSKVQSITVDRDLEAATTAVQDFVDSYNELMDEFSTHFSYNAKEDKAGLLLGNGSASGLQALIREAVLGSVAGVNANANRLSAVGITFNNEGKLDFDSARLTKALNGEQPGVSADDVRRLFALDATSSHSGIQYMTAGAKTNIPAGGIQVDITQAARQASITGASPIADNLVIDASNDTLSIRLDGRQATDVKLQHGTWTRDELASMLQSSINNHSVLIGRLSSVSVSGGALSIQSDTYGSTSEIAITGGSAAATLGLTGTELSKGTDVIGRFIVNGVEEPATGNGRLLMGVAGNAHTASLQVRVTLGQAQVQAGPEATLTMTRGVTARLEQTLSKLLDSQTGRIKFVNDGFDDKMKALQVAIDRQNAFFEKQEKKLLDQFTALETTLSQLQATSSYLSAQLMSVNEK